MALTFQLIEPRSPVQGLLGEFSFRRAIIPTILFCLTLIIFYNILGRGPALSLLFKLWISFATAYVLLSVLSLYKGNNPPWHYVLGTALLGVISGGALMAITAQLDHIGIPLDMRAIAKEWATGTAFSTFFISLSLGSALLRRNEQEKAMQREQVLEAQVRALTAQVEPHFLMNTLANLRHLMRKDITNAQTMLDHMADFFQGALIRARSSQSYLGQELDLVKSYLHIMGIRLGEKLQWSICVPAELHSKPFPSLLLQTLVENAIKHGIEPMENGGIVEISAKRTLGKIQINITDNGVGIPQEQDQIHGIGLSNTRDRLASFYRGNASFDIQSTHSGTCASITIPD